jgi:hypothetical protein
MDVVVPVFGSTTAMVLWLLITVAMPVVVGLLSKPQTPAAVKALGLVLASLLNGFLSEWLAAGDGYDLRKAILQVVVSFVIAGASYARVWRPLGVTDAAQRAGAGVAPRRVD